MKRRAFLFGAIGFLLLLPVSPLPAGNAVEGGQPDQKEKGTLAGQRVFVCGHSFHVFLPKPIEAIAKAAGYKDHVTVGLQSLGGSRTIQHWNLPDEKNKAKQALKTGKVDVLTLSPHLKIPDEGIDHFAQLALEHNPKARVLVQVSWIPFDLGMAAAKGFKLEERNQRTVAELHKPYQVFLKALEEQARAINDKHKTKVVFLVPVGEAVIKLRELVSQGKVPGIAKQADLFTDAIGHAKQPIVALNAYCHFVAIYRRSPVGLPPLGNPKDENARELHRLLQELAWETVSKYPGSGVREGN